jgi:putative ABC transport system permease protein
MINRSFADTYFPGTTPIGHHLQEPANPLLPGGEIRGIAGDAREEGLNREPVPTVYWCVSAPDPDPYYLVRTKTDPSAMVGTLRRKIHEIEPARSIFDIIPLEEHLNDAFAENRLRTILLTFFAVTAVSLACIGLYGTLSYSVTVRRREVGLRLALGARQGQIVKQFLLQGLTVTLLGCGAGWALAAAFARVLSGMLYGVSPSDVPTLFTVVFLMLLVAASAALVPAIRASHDAKLAARQVASWRRTKGTAIPSIRERQQRGEGTRSPIRWRRGGIVDEILVDDPHSTSRDRCDCCRLPATAGCRR